MTNGKFRYVLRKELEDVIRKSGVVCFEKEEDRQGLRELVTVWRRWLKPLIVFLAVTQLCESLGVDFVTLVKAMVKIYSG